ncbi:MAG: hypothetical protein F4010_00140 [Cenarchaeum sp. SB0669_bin_11]|nr:hypothetical protein [Cenarchaeum sp. SB0675_bin_21]MYL10575.1 hypothetical protein [Cenarchaeum sp. SB0669_bin_11]
MEWSIHVLRVDPAEIDAKNTTLDINGEGRTIPSRRGLPHEPGHSTSEKNRSIMTVCFQRVTEEEQYVMIMDVPRGGRALTDIAQGQR